MYREFVKQDTKQTTERSMKSQEPSHRPNYLDQEIEDKNDDLLFAAKAQENIVKMLSHHKFMKKLHNECLQYYLENPDKFEKQTSS